MTEQPEHPEKADDPSASAESWTTDKSGTRWWLIPAVTFLVGLVLGGGVIALAGLGSDGTPSAGSTTTPVPSPTRTTAPDLVVPGDCVQVATDSQALLSLVDEAAQAARDLDAAKLSDLVAELRAQQQIVRDQAAACQSAAAATPSPTTS